MMVPNDEPPVLADQNNGIANRQSVRDDRVLAVTRWVAALLIPPLVTAFIVLYLLPSPDGRSFAFAWPIRPIMTGIVMGSGYLGGAYFFARVVIARRWHYLTLGFLPVTSFASLMLLTTILHWDRFDRSGLAFGVWLGLYIIAPILVPVLWLSNRKRDPGSLVASEFSISRDIRRLVGVLGACLIVSAVLLFIWPDPVIAIWPWQLTPLTARILASWLMLPGVGALGLMTEPRWSSWRVVIESISLWLALLVIGIVRNWQDFDQSRPLIGFVWGIPLALAGLLTLYVIMEVMRRRRTTATTGETAS